MKQAGRIKNVTGLTILEEINLNREITVPRISMIKKFLIYLNYIFMNKMSNKCPTEFIN
jgi:hypothetical protein